MLLDEVPPEGQVRPRREGALVQHELADVDFPSGRKPR